MSKFSSFVLILVFALILGGCANLTSQASNQMIDPGEKINTFLIDKGKEEGVSFMILTLDCQENNELATTTCEFPTGTQVNVSNGMYDTDPNSGQTLDEIWASHTSEMTIGGTPVNLQAFGTADTKHVYVGTIRTWNVTVSSIKPGQITVKTKDTLDQETVEKNFVVIFKEP